MAGRGRKSARRGRDGRSDSDERARSAGTALRTQAVGASRAAEGRRACADWSLDASVESSPIMERWSASSAERWEPAVGRRRPAELRRRRRRRPDGQSEPSGKSGGESGKRAGGRGAAELRRQGPNRRRRRAARRERRLRRAQAGGQPEAFCRSALKRAAPTPAGAPVSPAWSGSRRLPALTPPANPPQRVASVGLFG